MATRRITREAVAAFIGGYDFDKSNTSVEAYAGGTTVMSLFATPIACKQLNGDIEISDAGHQTVATKARLNGLMEALEVGGIYQKEWEWFLMTAHPSMLGNGI